MRTAPRTRCWPPLATWATAAAAVAAVTATACRAGSDSPIGYKDGSQFGGGASGQPSQPGGGGTGGGQTPNGPNNPNGPNKPADPNSPAGGARVTQFAQGLFRGQDPRLVMREGNYFFTGYLGANLTLYKSKSMVDLGVGKSVAQTLGGALGSPIYIDQLGGKPVGAWFLFGSESLFVNSGDPYDNADAWKVATRMPWTDVGDGFPSVPFDFEVFKNPQDGPYKDRWYLIWVRNDAQATYFEHIFAAEIQAISPTGITLSQTASTAANRILTARGPGDWTDVIAEAPGAAIHEQSVTLAYSGNGAPTTLYAVGLATLKQGADPSQAGAWLDLSHGDCDGFPGGNQPAFGKTAEVWGPGVSRFVKSADGTEDWVIYNSKIFNTRDEASQTPEPQQSHNEMWSRYISIQKIGWQNVTCSGKTYAIPQLGQPLPPGKVVNLPAGDPGPTAKRDPYRIEAESMIAFGYVMGPSVQSLSTPNTAVTGVACQSCSSGYKHARLAELARDQPTAPKTSGILYRNCPPASGLNIAHANAAASSVALWVGGKMAQNVALPATGDENRFVVTPVTQAIRTGDELRLVYEDGKSTPVDFDYVELLP